MNSELNSWKRYSEYDLSISLAKKVFHELHTIVDVGVHDGDNLIELSKEFPNVIGFEPGPQWIEIDSMIKQYPNVTCYNLALSNKIQTKNFYIDKLEPYISGFNQEWVNNLRHFKDEPLDVVPLTTITLDSLLVNKNIEQINLIKIDAEDEDDNVIFGSERIIKKHKPIIQSTNITPEGEQFLFDLDYHEFQGLDINNQIVSGDGTSQNRFFINKINTVKD